MSKFTREPERRHKYYGYSSCICSELAVSLIFVITNQLPLSEPQVINNLPVVDMASPVSATEIVQTTVIVTKAIYSFVHAQSDHANLREDFNWTVNKFQQCATLTDDYSLNDAQLALWNGILASFHSISQDLLKRLRIGQQWNLVEQTLFFFSKNSAQNTLQVLKAKACEICKLYE